MLCADTGDDHIEAGEQYGNMENNWLTLPNVITEFSWIEIYGIYYYRNKIQDYSEPYFCEMFMYSLM